MYQTKKLSLILVLLVLVIGTGLSVTEVEDWNDLNDVREDLSSSYELINNLDSNTPGYDTYVDTDQGWSPIGSTDDGFSGIFYGEGHEIRDLYINRSDENAVGLFASLDPGAEIQRIGIVDAEIIGNNSVGTLLGRNLHGDKVRFSYATGEITGEEEVGGLVGRGDPGADLENCYTRVTVHGDKYVGGLVGYRAMGSRVTKTYSTGEVNGNDHVGGLIGDKEGGTSISNSFWDVDTSGIDQSDGGTGKSTLEMNDVSTFTDLDTEGLDDPWDFIGDPYDDTGDEDIWGIDEDINDGYPFFVWQNDIDYLPVANFTYEPEEPETEEEINFIDQSVPGDSDIVEWSWIFDDGTTSPEQNPVHVYEEKGNYTVELTVGDEEGFSSTYTREIVVDTADEENDEENDNDEVKVVEGTPVDAFTISLGSVIFLTAILIYGYKLRKNKKG